MPRERFQTLTEQMFYILLCLKTECCGTDIMNRVGEITGGRVTVGAGTLYALLDSFVEADMITHVSTVGRRRSYVITRVGLSRLEQEYERLKLLASDFEANMREGLK